MNLRRLRILVLLPALLLLGGLLGAPQASASAGSPYCGLWWGSLPEKDWSSSGIDVLVDVRAGQHACFDRVVVDLRGPAGEAPPYDIRYVDSVHQPGSGHRVDLRGGAALQVVVGAPSYEGYGRPTYQPANRDEIVDVEDFRTLEQVAWAGSYEGRTTLGIGTRARLPFRVFFLLDDPDAGLPTRLVIDVAHSW